MHNKTVHQVAFILLVVGGLNWLFVAFNYNIVNVILGGFPAVENLIYILIGLAAVYELVAHKKNCTHCGADSGNSSGSTDSASDKDPSQPQV